METYAQEFDPAADLKRYFASDTSTSIPDETAAVDNFISLECRPALDGTMLEAGAQNINRLDFLVEIRDLPEQPTEALLGMRRKWEDDQEFSRAEWDVLARYAEKGCEQHGLAAA